MALPFHLIAVWTSVYNYVRITNIPTSQWRRYFLCRFDACASHPMYVSRGTMLIILNEWNDRLQWYNSFEQHVALRSYIKIRSLVQKHFERRARASAFSWSLHPVVGTSVRRPGNCPVVRRFRLVSLGKTLTNFSDYSRIVDGNAFSTVCARCH